MKASFVDWDQIDENLVSPEFFAGDECHATFELLRREDPVHWTPGGAKHGFWSVTRHADMLKILRTPELFSNRAGTSLPRGGTLASPDDHHASGFRADIANMDPPEHGRYRQPSNKHFSAPAATRMRAEIESLSDSLLDAIAPRGECELVEEVAAQLPVRLFFPLLGIPESDRAKLRSLTSAAQLADDEAFQTQEDAGKTRTVSQTVVFNYMLDMVRARRERPTDDFTSVISAMRVDGALMPERIAARAAMGVLVGGLETTRNALAIGLLTLMENKRQATLLRSDPSLARSAGEEILRWVTPSRNRLRIANEDIEFHGRKIRAGDWVVMWTLSANRDEAAFTDPHRLDITRVPNDHLSFGNGIHLCLGRHVARLEISTLASTFVRRFPDARPVGDREWIASQGANGLKRLFIRFTPEQRRQAALATT